MSTNPALLLRNRKRQRSSPDAVEHPSDADLQQPKRRRTDRSIIE